MGSKLVCHGRSVQQPHKYFSYWRGTSICSMFHSTCPKHAEAAHIVLEAFHKARHIQKLKIPALHLAPWVCCACPSLLLHLIALSCWSEFLHGVGQVYLFRSSVKIRAIPGMTLIVCVPRVTRRRFCKARLLKIRASRSPVRVSAGCREGPLGM